MSHPTLLSSSLPTSALRPPLRWSVLRPNWRIALHPARRQIQRDIFRLLACSPLRRNKPLPLSSEIRSYGHPIRPCPAHAREAAWNDRGKRLANRKVQDVTPAHLTQASVPFASSLPGPIPNGQALAGQQVSSTSTLFSRYARALHRETDYGAHKPW